MNIKQAYDADVVKQLSVSDRFRTALRLIKEREMNALEALRIFGLDTDIFGRVLVGYKIETEKLENVEYYNPDDVPSIDHIKKAVENYENGTLTLKEALKQSELGADIFSAILRGSGVNVKKLNVMICGGAGFIGSNLVHHMVNTYPDYKIVNVDKLTYAGNIKNLENLEGKANYKFYQADIVDPEAIEKIITEEEIDAIINLAAETHVDRSIHIGSREFVMTNTVGVQTLLDAARRHNLFKMVNISTDEVYGSLGLDEDRKFTEETSFEPNVPYAAAKAGGDLMCRSYYKTFGVPVIVSHCSNNYGPYQFPEKVVPFFIRKAAKGEKLPVYGDGKNVRDWIYVADHAKAIDLMLHKGIPGEVYNIGADNEMNNLELAGFILKHFGLNEDMIRFVVDRPGHDRRYAVDSSKTQKDLGWKPEHKFEEAMEKTIKWYLDNPGWADEVEKRNADINKHIK